MCWFSNQVEHFKKKMQTKIHRIKKGSILGVWKNEWYAHRKKTQNKTIVPHLKSNQCLALDTPQEAPPGRDGERKNIKVEMWL